MTWGRRSWRAGFLFKRRGAASPLPSPRSKAVSAAVLGAAGVLILGLGLAFIHLGSSVRSALAPIQASTRPLTFAVLQPPRTPLESWGGADVEAVVVLANGLVTAGAYGVGAVTQDRYTDLSSGLPTLAATSAAQWRGHLVVGLKAGGLFLRRHESWEEARSGWGTLHVRTLVETEAGELLVGAREGLFRAAWGSASMDRLDARPVRSLAVGAGFLLAGGEEGLRRIEPSRVWDLPVPDPWVEMVGLDGSEAVVVTAAGLARGPCDGRVIHKVAGSDIVSAALVDGTVFALAGPGAMRVQRIAAGRTSEDLLPEPARRLMVAQGVLFADTGSGLLRRDRGGWSSAGPRATTLPRGPSHVTALAWRGEDLVAGLFDGGLAVGRKAGTSLAWQTVPGAQAWGVNALLPAGDVVYVASLRGAARFDGRTLTPIEGPGAAFSLASTPEGLAIGYGQGVLLPGARLLSAFHGLPGNQALALASGDALFVGTPTGLGALDGRRVRFRVAPGEGKLPHPWVTALAVSGDTLYVGTYGGGVARRFAPRGEPAAGSRRDNGRYEAFPETGGLKVNPGCLVEAAGRLYLGTDGRGLFRLAADRRRFVPLRLPLPSPRVTSLIASRDALYVGTDEGIARVPLAPGSSPETETE